MKDLIVNEKSLIISILIVTFISFFLYTNQPDEHGITAEVTTLNMILSFAYSIISSAYVIISIRLIRGKNKTSSKPPHIESELSIWDYIWRYFAVAWVSSFSLIALVFLPIDTLVGKVLFSAIIIILVPTITLILFGENRIEKIKQFIMYFTGIPKL